MLQFAYRFHILDQVLYQTLRRCDFLNRMAENENFDYKFNPNGIDISIQQISLYYLLKRLENNEIDLFAPYQRGWNVWDVIKQSRLIESILIRIPIPSFYFDSGQGDKWQVVDGLQRVSTFYNFIIKQNFRLKGLEFLPEYEGYLYSDLPRVLQRRIEECTLTVHMINSGTPEDIKFVIFSRINTGGVKLNSQELRYALNQGKATDLLTELSTLPLFIEATYSPTKDRRMENLELINRFIAFYQSYNKYSGNLDTFMNQELHELNEQHGSFEKVKHDFNKSMLYAIKIFGNLRFKILTSDGAPKKRINKAMFDAVSVNLAWLTQDQLDQLLNNSEQIIRGLYQLFESQVFINSVTVSTNTKARVYNRFESIKDLFFSNL